MSPRAGCVCVRLVLASQEVAAWLLDLTSVFFSAKAKRRRATPLQFLFRQVEATPLQSPPSPPPLPRQASKRRESEATARRPNKKPTQVGQQSKEATIKPRSMCLPSA